MPRGMTIRRPSTRNVPLLLVLIFLTAVSSAGHGVQGQSTIVSVTVGGSQSGGAAYDSAKGEVFIANFDASTVSVISDTTNSVVATVNVGAGADGVTYDPSKGEVFVSHSIFGAGAGLVSVISDATNAVVANISVSEAPGVMVYDPGVNEVFVGGYTSETVVSDSSNAAITNVTGISGAGSGAYDPAKGEVFVSQASLSGGASYVYVISDSNDSLTATILVGLGPAGVAYDPSKSEIFVANNGDGTVSVISDATNKVVSTVQVGASPEGVVYDPATGDILVANSGDGTMSVISDATNKVIATNSMGGPVSGLVYDSGKGEIFVTYQSGNSVVVIPDNVSSVSISGSSSSGVSSSTQPATNTGSSSQQTVACTTQPMTAPNASSSGIGGWAPTNCYPDDISGESCVTSGGYIYCVGGGDTQGITSAVYYASLSPNGVGSWKATTSYPEPISGESCVIQTLFITCIGGDTASTSVTNAPETSMFTANFSSSGVGAWQSLGSYPTYISSESCNAVGYEVYCVGGFNGERSSASDILGTTDQVYYSGDASAPEYLATDNYPVYVEAQPCSVSGGLIYCVGGFTVDTYVGTVSTTYNSSSNITFTPDTTGAVYFAPLSSSTGPGPWSAATSYPTKIFDQSCVTSQAMLYCVGGNTLAAGEGPTAASYYTSLSPSGTGTWTQTTSYPNAVEGQSCVAYSGFIYCVGGTVNITGGGPQDNIITNAVCYAQIGTSNSTVSSQAQSSSCAPPPPSTTQSSSTTQSGSQPSTSSSATGGSSLAIAPSYLGLVAVEVMVLVAVLVAGARKTKYVTSRYYSY